MKRLKPASLTSPKPRRLPAKEAYVLERMKAGARAYYVPLCGSRPGYWGFEGKPCHLTLVNLIAKAAVTVRQHMGERVGEVSPHGLVLLEEHGTKVQAIAHG